MGFGLLFFGYLFSMNTVAYPGFTKVFAYLFMLLAMTKMAPYEKRIKKAFYVLIPTSVIGFLYLLLEFCNLFGLLSSDFADSAFRILPFFLSVAELVFLYPLLRGLQALAKETEVPHLELGAARNRIFTVIYYLFLCAGQLNFPDSMARFMAYFSVALLLFGLFVMILNAKLFYGFYMWICLPEDLAMERKTSSIPLLNALYKKIDRHEEAFLKKRQEADAMRKEEKRKRKEHSKK